MEEYVDQIKAELHAAELEHMLATAKLSEYFERAENGAVQLVTALYQDLSIPVLLKQSRRTDVFMSDSSS